MTQPTERAVPDQGVFARALGVIFSPSDTLRGVVVRPRPAGILLLVCVVAGLSTGLFQMTERGRQATVDMQVQQMEMRSGAPVTPEMYAQFERFSPYLGYVSIVSTFVMVPAMTMLFAGLCWALFNTILGGTAEFRQVLGVVAHSQVILALGALLSAPIQYVQGIQSVAGPFNLGALAPMLEPGTFLASFLSAISVFVLWQAAVTGVGLAILYKRRSGPIVIGLLLFSLAFVAALTAAFSG